MGNWWIFGALLVAAAVFYSYGVPRAKARVFIDTQLRPKLLDEYIPTWRSAQAPILLEGIGVNGRRALQQFYLRMDLWFPGPTICAAYLALLSLAFPISSGVSWLILLVLPALFFEVAENVNHLAMTRRYPTITAFSVVVGPSFTLLKWSFAIAIPFVAIVGFVIQLVR
jgi:hypothetical protein